MCVTVSFKGLMTDAQSREAITLLHVWHRTLYMGERLNYYARRYDELHKPFTVWSLIGWWWHGSTALLTFILSRAKDYWNFETLSQHLQGVYAHGQLMRVYRTFHNVTNNSNMQIHFLLLTIECLILKNSGRLPEKLFYQIDGGSENTARCWRFASYLWLDVLLVI